MINFQQFTLNNEGVKELAKVMFTTAFLESDLFDTCTRATGVVNGSVLDFVDNLGEVGWSGRGCNPEYKSVQVKGIEKKWELGDWQIPLTICYKELENTIAQYSLATGTAKADIIGGEFWNKIFNPLLEKALRDFYWRTAWFSDKNAANISDNGVITNGVDVDLLNMCDGLWKKLIAITATTPAQRTVIAANTDNGGGSSVTYASQKAAIKTDGVALGILDGVLSNADSRIQANGGVMMMTNSLYQAARKDYAKAYKDTIPFKEVAEGLTLPTYDGVPMMPINMWDTLITKYENDGTKLNNPHRLVFANKNNLFLGTSATSTFAEFDTFFDRKSRTNNTYAASDNGTLVGEDALVHVAI